MSKKITTPLVSIIIPCYNAEKYIEETILSVIRQTYTKVEIVVIDDGSTDNSATIIKGLSRQYNLKYFFQDNTGVSTARNAGIMASSGEYIVPLDADDILLPESIEKKVKLAVQGNYDLVYSWVEVTDDNLNSIKVCKGRGPQNLLDELFVFSPPAIISPSSTLIKRAVFNEIGYFDTNLSVSADVDMWIRIAKSKKVGQVAETLSQYRLVPGSMNTNVSGQIHDMNIIFAKYANAPMYTKKLLTLKKGFYYSIAGNGWVKRNYPQVMKFASFFLWTTLKLFMYVRFSRIY